LLFSKVYLKKQAAPLYLKSIQNMHELKFE